MGGLLHLVQRGGAWAGCGPAHPLLVVPNVKAHPSTASVGLPVTVLLYDGPLLCGFNVAIKGLTAAVDAINAYCRLTAPINYGGPLLSPRRFSEGFTQR